MENDRCDIEFTYEWKTINNYLDYLTDTPTYLLNAGDAISITFKSLVPNKVTFVTNSYSIELTQSDMTWSATIPTTYTKQESFSIIIDDTYLLYQGLLNNTSVQTDLEAIVKQHTLDILDLQTRVKALEEKVGER